MLSRNTLAVCKRGRAALCLPIRHRTLATVTDTPEPSSSSSSNTTPPSTVQPYKPNINTAVILNRSPLITRTPTNFERSYYAYHARIQRALFNPFPDEFYFKQGSLLEGKFLEEEKERDRLAFGGPQFRKGKDGDESVATSAPEDSLAIVSEQKEEDSAPRIHESDRTGNVRSLDRQGERNLYLLLQIKSQAGANIWRFPQGGLQSGEPLHEAAERALEDKCDSNMDTWVVSRNPIGVLEPDLAQSSQAYVFFYKAHILAGQVRPHGKDILDFAWLTKQEIEPRVDPLYWSGIKDMLSDF
ncbi:uncharacterized protein FIBRA_05986 [Fibroporia radiculosa]|uniref:Large ribosomal subunit protein mL46 n=1 Tax=Fibroporia radiculosa TaxID=599839 RepID=J4HYE3_9APHY|nr:uncharacterized protein FIBRA_05986 [Fibroporia radiculosa]CCM03837.1 predicted protein [Fibroporia radiculosa]